MKTLLIAALTTLSLSFGAYAEKDAPKAKETKPAGKEEPKDTGKKEEHAHDHARKAGPTGGRLITAVEPHVEFFVTKEKKVEIRFVDDDNKVVAPGTQEISVTLGERAKPTKLTFAKDGDKLVSDKTVPEGNDYPTVVQIRAKKGAKPVNEKFNLNMSKCETCDSPEYACTCDHDAEKEKEGKKEAKKEK
ncbi:MAG TPA: hypothetical protein VHM91_03385 [Verrucomicrobiales bacterium]|nr:hypothetical protein [Verrucomicrobiales bacterium]